MNPSLIAALITQIGVPEAINWLHSRNGTPITDADIIAKLATDAKSGEDVFAAYLAQNGLTA